MPRSFLTRRLNAAAHSLGDLYYRNLLRSGNGDPGLQNTAREYVAALETLKDHLSTLPKDPEVEMLIESTNKYIGLVNRDLLGANGRTANRPS